MGERGGWGCIYGCMYVDAVGFGVGRVGKGKIKGEREGDGCVERVGSNSDAVE